MILTAGELISRLNAFDAEDRVYLYCGDNGITVQVEPPASRPSIVASCSTAKPQAGGPAQ